jgi:molybdopterin/thiamine biosynthesis adenylyltransferase
MKEEKQMEVLVTIEQKIVEKLQSLIKNGAKSGSLLGCIHPEVFQIMDVSVNEPQNAEEIIGEWQTADTEAETPAPEQSFELLVKSAFALEAKHQGKSLPIRIWDRTNFNLRNRGILNSRLLADKTCVLVGDGTLGSAISRLYSLLGIHQIIFDHDRLEETNPIRWAGVGAPLEYLVGRLKVSVSKDTANYVNPDTLVEAYPYNIMEEPELFEQVIVESKPSLIICTTDTEDSRQLVNAIAYPLGIPTIYASLSDGAVSGQIIIVQKGDACYDCVLGGGGEQTPFKQRKSSIQYAVDTENAAEGVPGLLIDIGMIAHITGKLGLVILTEGPLEKYTRGRQVLWFSMVPEEWLFYDAFQTIWASVDQNNRHGCLVCDPNAASDLQAELGMSEDLINAQAEELLSQLANLST